MKVKLCTNSDLKINLHLNEIRILTINDADVAQLGEHETEDLRVAGSIPAISTFLFLGVTVRDLKIKPNVAFFKK